MKRRQIEALATLGVERRKYVLLEDRKTEPDKDQICAPRIWGLELAGPRGTRFVEYETDQYGGCPRYYVRRLKGAADYDHGFKTQREAIASFIAGIA